MSLLEQTGFNYTGCHTWETMPFMQSSLCLSIQQALFTSAVRANEKVKLSH